MIDLFLDCEFNSFGGKLLSMGIVDNNGRAFYEIIHYDNIVYDPWVKEHVLPIINECPPHKMDYKGPIPFERFQQKLEEYLSYYSEGFRIIVDWPDDIRYFCESIITGPGIMMNIPEFECLMTRRVGTSGAKPQHNALADAIAIRNNYQKLIESILNETI